AKTKELEERLTNNQEALEKEKKKLEQEFEAKRNEAPETLRRMEIESGRRWILGIIFLAGLLGGLAIHMLEYLQTVKPFKKDWKRARQLREARDAPESEKNWELLKELEQQIPPDKKDQEKLLERIRWERRTWWTRYDELGSVLFLGIV